MVSYADWEDYFDITPELKVKRLLKNWDTSLATLGEQDLDGFPFALLDEYFQVL